MDEVEVIQNYLIGQAGEGTDVILGMGYDNSLGDKIGITLIATGFEHKDPFKKKKQEKKDEKLVFTLSDAEQEKKEKPAVKEEKPVEKSEKKVEEPVIKPELAPKLIDVEPQTPVQHVLFTNEDTGKSTVENKVDKNSEVDPFEWI